MSIVRVSDLRQQVYDDLRQRMLNGEFASDTKFQEIALAESLGVSRTPVREALAMLVRDGLLVQMRRGFRFPKHSPRDVVNIIEVRMRLEPYAMRRLVEKLDADQRAKLAQYIRDEIALHGDSENYIAAHFRIRRRLLENVENKVLAEAIHQFEDFIHLMRSSTLKDPQWRQKSTSGNLKLADAIEAGDAETTEKIQFNLLEMARDSFLNYLATQDDETAEN